MNAPMKVEEWRRLPRRARARAWRNWDASQRLAMIDLFAATTPGWALPYPVDYNDPADSPNVLQALATKTDTSLTTVNNSRMPVTMTKANIAKASGWTDAENYPTVSKTGKLVVLSGAFGRSATLTVSANTSYTLGTLPAGYRPASVERAACAWSSDGVRHIGIVWIYTLGTIDWIPTLNDGLHTNDWVAIGGVSFVAP